MVERGEEMKEKIITKMMEANFAVLSFYADLTDGDGKLCEIYMAFKRDKNRYLWVSIEYPDACPLRKDGYPKDEAPDVAYYYLTIKESKEEIKRQIMLKFKIKQDWINYKFKLEKIGGRLRLKKVKK